MVFPDLSKATAHSPIEVSAFVGVRSNENVASEIMAYLNPRKDNNGDPYYENVALSNSFLMNALKVIAGTKDYFNGSSNAFEIGKAFEDLLMDRFRRERYAKTISQNELETILLMVERFKESFSKELKERVSEDDPQDFIFEGLKFKVKTDFETSDTTFDIKTTSKVDLKGCQASIYAYNYHTQGYLYEIATKKPFVLLFQSKSYPFDNFKIELTDKMREKAKLKIDKAIAEVERLELTKHFTSAP